MTVADRYAPSRPQTGTADHPVGGTVNALAYQILRQIYPGDSRLLEYNMEQGMQYRVVWNGYDDEGKPMYRVYYQNPNTGIMQTEQVTYSGGDVGVPTISRGPRPIAEPGSQQPFTGVSAYSLAPTIQTQLARLVQNERLFDEENYNQIYDTIVNWDGDRYALIRYTDYAIEQQYGGSAPKGGAAVDNFDPFAGLDFGGGFAAPVYKAPDKRVVRDFVKRELVQLLGADESTMRERLVDLYMKDHRRDWDSPSQTIEPGQSVIEAIRDSELYQQIHKLRPEEVEEHDWIMQRHVAALSGGLDVEEAQAFAVEQAIAGGDEEDVETAASYEQIRNSGQAPPSLQNAFGGVATAMFSRVGR